jgi:peptide/nickel transport system permease protein
MLELESAVSPPEAVAAPRTLRDQAKARSRFRRVGFVLAVVVLAVVLLWAIVPGLFASASPLTTTPTERLQAPSWHHLFGTDALGRDLWSRVVYGARASVKATGVAVLIGITVGTTIGMVSGFIGGWVDSVMMRFIDVLLAIPALLISLTIVTALGFGVFKVALAVGIAAIAGFARVMRSEVLRVRSMPYVEAAITSGVRPVGIAVRTVMPHAIGSVLVLAALELGTAILAVSALSFLGFGAAPPEPEWGLLIADGRNYVATAWWLTTLPGLVIALAVLSTNVVSRHLRTWKDVGR